MSFKATTWAWEQDTESSGQRLVLLALADATGGDDDDPRVCWPSVARIGRMTKLGERIVRKHIDRLEEMGLVTKHERRRRDDGTLSVWVYLVNFTTGTGVPLVTTGTPVPEVPEYLRYSSTAQEPSLSIVPSLDLEETTDSPSKPVVKPKTRARTAFPADWTPGADELEVATKAGMDERTRRHEWGQFRSHHEAKGSLMASWPAAWRTWCGNYRTGRFQPAGKAAPGRLTEHDRIQRLQALNREAILQREREAT